MAAIPGGTVRNPHTGEVVSWRPTAGTADSYLFVVNHTAQGYRQLGVIGNPAHLAARKPGDHTPWSTHAITIHGKTLRPLKGWVYADDCRVPEPDKFERWFLGRLRAGAYPHVKYFNVNGRHWHRAATRAGLPFGWSAASDDHHLHTSRMPGAEYTHCTVLADYEAHRTGNPPKPPKPPQPIKRQPVRDAAAKLPAVRRGVTGRTVKILQGGLNAAGYRLVIDGDFGPATDRDVRAFQRGKGLVVDGIVGPKTWDRLLPDNPPTVIRGTVGPDVRVMQGLLTAHGWTTTVDGRAGDHTISQLQKFQVARRVPQSVVNGHGDGIGGVHTWVALVTP